MVKTRRQLDAENKALRARLGTTAGETRKLLNERVKRAEKLVGELRAIEQGRLDEIRALLDKIEVLEMKLFALREAKADNVEET